MPLFCDAGFGFQSDLLLEDSGGSSDECQDNYTMLDTTLEQAKAWQSSLLSVHETPASERGDDALSAASFEPEHAVPDTAQRVEYALSQV